MMTEFSFFGWIIPLIQSSKLRVVTGPSAERVFAIQYSRVCEEMHTHTHTQITSMEDYSFNFD